MSSFVIIQCLNWPHAIRIFSQMDAIIVTGNRIGKRIYDSRDAITRPHMIVIFGLLFILCENIVV